MRSSLFLNTVSWSVLCLFCMILAISFFVPIYTDEITIKIARVQVLFDGFELTSLFPQCSAAFSLPVPLTWRPSALLDWLIYGNATTPIFLRIVGVSTFVIWLGSLAWFMRRNMKAQISSLHLMAGLIAIASLGILPFMLALNRSEQVLVVGLTLICMLPFCAAQYQLKSNWVWLLWVASFCLAVSYMFSSHPKTFFFIPLMFVSAIHLSVVSRRSWVSVILLGGLGWICYESLTFWTKRMSCPDAPFLDEILKTHSLSTGLLFLSPINFFHSGLDNLAGSKEYINNILFQSRYQSDWLPFGNENKLDRLSTLVNFSVKAIYVLLVGYFLAVFAKRLRTDWRKQNLVAQTTIPAALLFGIVATSFFMLSKNFYESSLIVPLVLLLFVILIIPVAQTGPWGRFHSIIFALLLVTSVFSQMNLIRVFATYIPNQWIAGGQVSGQALSISTVNYTNVREEIIEAAAHCGIRTGESNTHLVVDDSTYFVFNDAYRPFHAGYIGGFFGRDIGEKKYLTFLKDNKSAGVIARCDKLYPTISKFATQSSDFCCISRQDIERLGITNNAIGE